MSKEFQTNYNRRVHKGEPGGGERRVEVTGYIPAKDQISNLINAGARLNSFRKEHYDNSADAEDLEDTPIDPTRVRNYDLADASRDLSGLEARLTTQKKAAKDEKKAQGEVEKPKAVDNTTEPPKSAPKGA